MTHSQRKAATKVRIMEIAQAQVAIIFAMPKEQQPGAWAEAAIAATQDYDKEVAHGCKMIYSQIAKEAKSFS